LRFHKKSTPFLDKGRDGKDGGGGRDGGRDNDDSGERKGYEGEMDHNTIIPPSPDSSSIPHLSPINQPTNEEISDNQPTNEEISENQPTNEEEEDIWVRIDGNMRYNFSSHQRWFDSFPKLQVRWLMR